MVTWLKEFWCDNRHVWVTVEWTIHGGRLNGWTRTIQVCWDCGRVVRDGIEAYNPLRLHKNVQEDYPGQAYYHAHNPAVKRAEENWRKKK